MPAQYGSKWVTGGPKALEDVTLPSGEVVLARRPGVQGLMKAGVINDLDALTGLVDANHNQRVNPSKKAKGRGVKPGVSTLSTDEVKSLLGDEGKLEAVLRVAAKVAAHCVARPSLLVHWKEVSPGEIGSGEISFQDLSEQERKNIKIMEADREFPEDPILFTDEVDMEDLMFLMNYAVGGTRDLAQFRSEFDESVASVESIQDVPLPSQ